MGRARHRLRDGSGRVRPLGEYPFGPKMTLRANLVAAAAAAAATAVLVLALQRLGFGVFALLAAAALAVVIVDRPAGRARARARSPPCSSRPSPYAGRRPRRHGSTARSPAPRCSASRPCCCWRSPSVVLDASRRGRLRTPRPLRLPLALVGLALVSGMIVGPRGRRGAAPDHRPGPDDPPARRCCPLLVVNVVRTPADVRAAIRLVVILTTAKAAIGAARAGSGTGRAVLRRRRAPHLLRADGELPGHGAAARPRRRRASGASPSGGGCGPPARSRCCASCSPSAGRSGSGRRRRSRSSCSSRPAGRAGGCSSPPRRSWRVALYVLFSSGAINASVDSPVGKRLTSLSPSKLAANPEDRYRIDERRNVVAELRDHPVAGLGMAQPWAARYPLSVEHEGGRFYVHFAVLWWWLKMGILGLVAYVGVMAAGVVLGLRIWRRATDEVIRAGGPGRGDGLRSASRWPRRPPRSWAPRCG